MRNWMRLLVKIIKDERGWVWPLIAAGAGAYLSSQSKKGEEEESIYDPYEALRGDWSKWMQGKLGTSTPYKYNEAFNLDQPGVEKAAESTIMGKLGNLPQAEEYKQKVEASKAQQIAREKERAGEQLGQEREMYNRLGLVSSTPFLSRAGELGDESLMRQGDIESAMDIYGLGYGLQSEDLMNQIAQGWTGAGMNLGAQQRGYQQYGQQMSMQDIMRMVEEEMGYGQQAAGLLGSNPPERTLTPDWLSQLGGSLTNIGSLGLSAGILGSGGGSTSGGGRNIGGGLSTNPNYKLINGKLVFTG